MKIGVCVPCYNRVEFTKYCIPMYIAHAGIEATWYLADDGSTDNTWVILNSIRKKHENVVLIKNEENIGIAKTRNKVYEKMMEDGMDIFVNVDNDILTPMNWLRDMALPLDNSPFDVLAPWMVNDRNINRSLKKMKPLNDYLPMDIVECPVGSTLVLYKRKIFEAGHFYPTNRSNWEYQDAQHHTILRRNGYKIGLYTGVQTWRLEHIIWTDMERIKLEVRHKINGDGTMDGFDKSLENRRGQVPFSLE